MLIGNANSSLTLKESLKLRVVWEGSTWVSWLESEMLELKPENSCYETTDMCFTFFSRNHNFYFGLRYEKKFGKQRKNEL